MDCRYITKVKSIRISFWKYNITCSAHLSHHVVSNPEIRYSNIGLAQIKMHPLLSLYFLPAFVLSCSFPKEPAGGEVTVTHLHPGGEAFFHCFTGYRLQGPKMLTCRNATTPYWSGKEPRCVGKTQQVFLCTPQVINTERRPTSEANVPRNILEKSCTFQQCAR